MKLLRQCVDQLSRRTWMQSGSNAKRSNLVSRPKKTPGTSTRESPRILAKNYRDTPPQTIVRAHSCRFVGNLVLNRIQRIPETQHSSRKLSRSLITPYAVSESVGSVSVIM